MRDIVEEALAGTGEHEEGTPPGEVQDVQIAVVGVGAAGVRRLTGIGRRLRDDAFVGQVPTDVHAVGVDLPGEESTVADWEPAAWHVVESLDAANRSGDVRLPPEETDRLRRFGGDALDRYDALVAAVDGTDPAAVAVASDLAAAFRGGVVQPVLAVPTIEAADPPGRLLAAESDWCPDTRDRFGPDAVVPIEHGRAEELAAGSGTNTRGPLATDTTDDAVERVAEAVTAALAEALGTRTQFGTLAEDLHHLRGRIVAHVGRQGEDRQSERRRLDAEALAEEVLATPLSDTPPDWNAGGAWLAHLRTPTPNDDEIDDAIEATGTALDNAAGIDGDERPATLHSYRHTATDRHELFLFRVERPDKMEDADRPPVIDLDDGELDEDTFVVEDFGLGGEDRRERDDADGDSGSGIDVVR